MRLIGIFPLFLAAWGSGCGQDVTIAPADCGTEHADSAVATVDASPVMRPDANTIIDVGTSLDGGEADAATTLACHVSRFASCDDPVELADGANNEPSSARFRSLTGGNGCRGDDFTAGSDSYGGRVCQTEPGDWFEYTYVPCDTLTIIAELRVRVTTACERDAWTLTVTNRPCDGSDPDVQCSWDGEWRVIQVLLPPSNSIGVFKFGMTQPDDATAYDYEWMFSLHR